MYRNRGELPNINTNTGNNGNGGYNVPHYSHYWNGRYVIVQYDKNFIAMELSIIFIIILTAFAVYLFAYKVSFEDPIATTKNVFLTAQLISIGMSLMATGFMTFFMKNKEMLIRNLKIVAIVSALILVVFLGIKVYIDNIYNEEKFGEFYEKYEQHNDIVKNENKISIGLSGMKISNLKESYIDKSVSAYTNFSIKVMLYVIIHILVIILILYLSYRLTSIEIKKEKLSKDDKILFDEETNIRF